MTTDSMEPEHTSIQNWIEASETIEVKPDGGPGLVNNGFALLNAPQENDGAEGGVFITPSPTIGPEKRGDCPPDKLHTYNGENRTENADSNFRFLLTPNSTRMSQGSQHSTRSSLPFDAFEMPATTVVPTYSNSTHKRNKSSLQLQEAIPIMPLPVALVCFVLNVIIPGSGTMLSGFIAFFLSRKLLSSYDRTMILCINCFVGLVQLATVVFLFIGWFWSITWGCAFVGLSSQYSKRVADENADGGIA